MPMASSINFSPSAESYGSSVRPPDFQNAGYPASQLLQGAHIRPSDQNACLILTSDLDVDDPSEPYMGKTTEEMSDPHLIIIEQPRNKWRYRYQSEKGSHGGLPGCNSTTSQRTVPTVKLVNYSGNEKVFIRASLWTNDERPTMHVHKLCGAKCDADGTCTVKLNEDNTAMFQDVTILFTAKKEVSKILYKRKLAYKMASVPVFDVPEQLLKSEAEKEAKYMNLNSVRICFEAYCVADGSQEHKLICPRIFSDPVANLKSPDAGDLKICRMSRVAGSVEGGDDVFLLVTKVNKKDVMVRFYETDSDWEDLGLFTEADVHYQYAIVFRTPPYHRKNIKKPVTVFLQLQRKSGEVGESKEFTYVPYDTDDDHDDGIRRKRRKDNSYHDSDGSGYGHLGSSGITDCSSSGNILSSSVNDPVNQSTLGNGSHCMGFSENVESGLMDTFDEHGFDTMCFLENSFSRQCTALIKPNLDPLLSEANVQRPKWNLPDTASIVDVENASSYVKTEDSESYDANEIIAQKQCDEQLEHTFNKLSICKEPTKKGSVNGGCASSCNLSQQTTDVNTSTVKHSDSGGKAEECKIEPYQDNDCCQSFAKRIWGDLALLLMTGDPFFVLKQAPHIARLSDDDGNTLLHLAVSYQRRNLDLVTSLLNVFKNISSSLINMTNNKQQAPLHLAIMKKKQSLVKLLIQYGADPTYPDKNGCTSFHLAVSVNSADCLMELLSESNYSTAKDKFHLEHFNHHGLSPLHCAVIKGSTECIRLLCAGGAEINSTSQKEGRRPLHFAIEQNIGVLRQLLAEKAIDVNAQDFAGNTPLHLACSSKQYDMVRELKLHEADPFMENFETSDEPGLVQDSGKTPCYFADEEILKILFGFENQEFKTDPDLDRPVEKQSVASASCGPRKSSRNDICSTGKSGCLLNKGLENHDSQSDSGFISGSVSQLSDEALTKLCKLLDPPGTALKELILYMGIDEVHLQNSFKLAPTSPSKVVIKMFLQEGGDMDMLIGALEAANLIEAHSFLKQYCKSRD